MDELDGFKSYIDDRNSLKIKRKVDMNKRKSYTEKENLDVQIVVKLNGLLDINVLNENEYELFGLNCGVF